MQVLRPDPSHLPSYRAALQRGWSPDSRGSADDASAELAAVQRDPALYLARLVDREALGAPVVLPDGSAVPRLPGIRHWLWDGEFCGVIALRWQPGTVELPPHVLGHIGYHVVPWKRRRGYARRALGLWLPVARAEGLGQVELTTDVDNLASQRVIEANGGRWIERFVKPAALGGGEAFRYRIVLA